MEVKKARLDGTEGWSYKDAKCGTGVNRRDRLSCGSMVKAMFAVHLYCLKRR